MIQVFGLRTMPNVNVGDNIGDHIVGAARKEGVEIVNHDILVVAQKIVSKAEGRVVDLRSITPSTMAETIASKTGKDPRHVEAILKQTKSVVKMKGPHLIVETHHGLVCANAGIDQSNVENTDFVALLPVDSDKSASKIRGRVKELTGRDVGVIVSDTFGRAWRVGQVNVAIGVDGLKPIMDYRGKRDMFGYTLNVTQMAVADELASAAELVMRKSDGVPVAIIRGFDYTRGRGSAGALIRSERDDLFR